MHRRSFLMSAAALPAWLAAAARAEEAERPLTSGEALPTAWRAARETGRPLLVLVIPPVVPPVGRRGGVGRQTGSKERGLRGLAWAQLFLFGTDEHLADIALCVVACATLDEVRRTIPIADAGSTDVGDDPLALVVEPDLTRVQGIDLRLEPISSAAFRPREVEAYEQRVRQRIESLGAALRAVLAPGESALFQRAARARKALPDLPAPRLSAEPSAALRELAARAPAVVRAAAESTRYREVTLSLLADIARTNTDLPPGALWGRHTGCGTRIEGLSGGAHMAMCGMGHTPKMGRRFLHFYTTT